MSDNLRIMLYDNTDWTSGLTASWFLGGALYRTLRRLDVCQGVSSWDETMDFLLSVEPSKKISQIQFWCHGSPGAVYLHGRPITIATLQYPNHILSKLEALKSRLTPETLIWFRTCATFAGHIGQDFATHLAKTMNCRIAGHTYIIGPWQSGLHSVGPYQAPNWPTEEGCGSSILNYEKWPFSGPRKPNTIFCLRGDVPKGW